MGGEGGKGEWGLGLEWRGERGLLFARSCGSFAVVAVVGYGSRACMAFGWLVGRVMASKLLCIITHSEIR